MFKAISEKKVYSNEERAEAFNMMGVIISSAAPYLIKGESNDIHFYKEALRLNPYCIGALLNIISAFGTRDSSMHLDKALFIQAYKVLTQELNDQLTARDKEELENRYQLYLSE
jgi:hypothetical protein